jgi:hypothetical protein
MAISFNPIFKINITGSEITTFDSSIQYPLSTKLEESYSMNSLSTARIVDLSNITNNRVILFQGSGDFSVSFTKSITSPLGEVFDYTFVLPVKKDIPTILDTTQAFVAGLKEISVATASVNLITIKVSAYGETV